MKLLQRLLSLVLPATTIQRMKDETNEWQIRCNGCGRAGSLWDAGGIRHGKAVASNATMTFVRCKTCRRLRSAVVEKLAEPDSERCS